jgi:hypothetical protein
MKKFVKKFRVFILALVIMSIVGIGGVIAANCDPPVTVDPGSLPFPVEETLIQHRLLGGVVAKSGTATVQVLSACDPDDDVLVFTATNMPTGMTITSATVDGATVYALNWTPTTAQPGTYYINIKVEDQPSSNSDYPPNEPALSDNGTIVFRVYKSNSAPILLPI